MRKIGLLIMACCLGALAQERPDPLERAGKLEREAERLLDEGRRAEALARLAEAADLREKWRDARADVPRRAGRGQPRGHAARAAVALAELDRAMEAGDAGAARRAAGEARDALAAWARDLEERERRLAKSLERLPVEQRLDELERQLREMKKLAEQR